jgi:hypothetical protein
VDRRSVQPGGGVTAARKTDRRRPYKPLAMRDSCHPLAQALWAAMNTREITMAEMAERSGVGEHTLYAWRRGGSATVANMEACLRVVGLVLTIAAGHE